MSGVFFSPIIFITAAQVAYASANKSTNVSIEMELSFFFFFVCFFFFFFTWGGRVSLFTWVFGRYVASTV